MNKATRLVVAGVPVALLATAHCALADVTLPRLMSDGLVLQRGAAANIWGWADDGEKITVQFDGREAGRATARDGQWQLALEPCAAGGPHTVTVTGTNVVTIHDVWCGDVWIASGQSNMELNMARVEKRYAAEVAAADIPAIRQFKVPRDYDFVAPRDDFGDGAWVAATPESVLQFSAVAYFFAVALHERTGVPIGIVSSNFGGSPAEGWMSESALADFPQYLEVAKRYRDDAYLQGLKDRDRTAMENWHAALDRKDKGLANGSPWFAPGHDDADWDVTPVPGYWADTAIGPLHGAVWFRKTVDVPAGAAGQPAELMLGRIVDADTAWLNGVQVGHTTYQYPPRRYQVEAGVLRPGRNVLAVRVVNQEGRGGFVDDKPYYLQAGDARIELAGQWKVRVGAVSRPAPAPLFLEYKQPLGFYNAMLAPLMPMHIAGAIWYQGESNVGRADEYRRLFPAMIRDWRRHWGQGNFPFIFVQLANFLEARAEPVDSEWAELRDAQRDALTEPATAMVVAIDVGEWNDIHPTDKKTVGDRLALAARKLAYGERDLVASGPVFQSMTADDGTLVLEFSQTGDGLHAGGDTLQGFAVAGADGVFHWASAAISGDTIRVHSAEVTEPRAVRYAWADNPDTANLYNSAGLPASPFQARLHE